MSVFFEFVILFKTLSSLGAIKTELEPLLGVFVSFRLRSELLVAKFSVGISTFLAS
jgi:hypothetical protein